MSFPVPVLLIAFNRPESTARVLAVLRQLRPAKLYVACDGPRPDRPGEVERCDAVRQLCSAAPGGGIDWPCELQLLLRQTNLGCRWAPSGAIDWLFAHEEQGIVIEDDILPDLSFFPYCLELLERYRDDERIGVIAANNHQRPQPSPQLSSYYFSIYSHCWGWATWRRAWRHYATALDGWPALRDSGALHSLGGEQFARVWTALIDEVAEARTDSVWDRLWQLSCWQQGLLTCLPAVELVENIGFHAEATHTLDERSPLAPRGALGFPLRHPEVIQADRRRDAHTFELLFRRSRRAEWARKLRKVLRLVGLR